MNSFNGDFLVNLYDLDFSVIKYKIHDIQFKRLLSPDADKVIDFVKDNFSNQLATEVKAAVYQPNPKCFVALYEKEIIGFIVYDATAKGFCCPMGLRKDYRNKGLGKNLLFLALQAMYFDGYGYAIIGGGVIHERFFKETCNAILIKNDNRIYSRLITKEKKKEEHDNR